MKKPKIRFKGYTDAWEQRKFGETVLIERGGSPRPIDKFITNDENGLNWVKIGDAPEQGNYITQTAEKIKPEGLKKTRQVFPGDLILSNSMSFGRPYIMGIEGCIHDGWLLIRDTNNSYDLKFLCVLLGSDQMFNQYKAFAAGSTVNNLNKELVGNTLVSVPTLEEQVKLGEYFSRIDHLITLHQRKCEETKKLKKYMLQKMFPKDGESVPEIRFSGFTNAWEQRKLNEIAKKVTEKNKDNLYDEPLTNSAEQGIISQKDYFDREVVNEENLDGYYVVQDNDFVYNPRVSVTAPVGPINRNKLGRNGVMSPLYTVFRTHDIDTCYLEYYFKTTSWHRFMKLNGDSGARFDRFSIASSLFMEMPIPYPCMDEQERIGEYFQYLDNLITLHQRKCEELQNMKKFMLQNMFA